MEIYYIYSMKQQVARHYYYKSDLLFRFLATCAHKNDQKDIMRQFTYVTHTIQAHQIIHFIKNISRSLVMKQHSEHDFTLSNGEQVIRLSLQKTYIKVICSSIFDAEQLLFQPLRSYPNYLFVVHANKHVYGWISMLKSDESSKSRQAL